jgi:K+-transporting ATPase ATPase A chain
MKITFDPGVFAGLALFIVIVTFLAYELSHYLNFVMTGMAATRFRILDTLERKIYRFIGTDPSAEQDWRGYAASMLIFNAIGLAVLLFILLAQGWLFLNPGNFPGFSPELAFNTAVSFVTNTNWQAYSGESAASYLTQTAGLAVQNFLSAATGICVALAVIRGMTRTETDRLGNFWVDLTRITLYVLVPLAFILAIFLVSQGVIQNYDPYVNAQALDPTGGIQIIPMGPVASQESIKELGTNGGGFFNANSAHPFENPTPLTNIVEIAAILLIAAALPFTFGRMAGDRRQGFALYAVMVIIFLAAFAAIYSAESAGNPLLDGRDISGDYLEGKEVRFGLGPSVLFAMTTTATSCGAVNTLHDSLTPLAGMIPMTLIFLGEIIFGGVGSGFYTLIAFALIAVFIAGLMIGRTPEYLGKKLESREMQFSIVTILTPNVLILVFAGIALVTQVGLAAIFNPGAHGLSEVMYAFGSMANNNGSAFAGLNAAQPFYLVSGGIVMLIGRFVPAVAMLAVAGSCARKKAVPPGIGTLPTYSPVFVIWLIGVIIIVGGLTFFPILAAGPIAEYFIMTGGV